MAELEIELADRIEDECDCCVGAQVRLTRFVYCGGDAHGVYYADFSPDHEDRVVRIALSLGEWGGWEGGPVPKSRVAFALRLRAAPEAFQTSVSDAAHSPWNDAEHLGRMLDRDEALAHPWIDEVFRISDCIVSDDHDVREYLEGS